MNTHSNLFNASSLFAPVLDYAQSTMESTLQSVMSDPSAEALGQLQSLLEMDPLEKGPVAELMRNVPASISLPERVAILRRSYPHIQNQKNALCIAASLLAETFQLYIPLAVYMANQCRRVRREHGRAALFGINGGQGSGKTTIHGFLNAILTHGLGVNTAGFSIDDVYKSYEQRQAMASKVHPLFAIRSVAGTHDTLLANQTLDALLYSDSDETIPIPSFDKMAKGGQGDRSPEAEWSFTTGPLDVVILEGWFVGALPQEEEALTEAVNDRESRDDADGVWRRSLNQHLASDYQDLFNRLDDLFVIQIRSMDDVFHNRELQEQHLRKKIKEAQDKGEDTGDSGAMSPEEVVDFISLYERTTRHMLETLPDVAKAVFYIGDHHKVEKVRINRSKD